jgi:hypothetical protein
MGAVSFLTVKIGTKKPWSSLCIQYLDGMVLRRRSHRAFVMQLCWTCCWFTSGIEKCNLRFSSLLCCMFKFLFRQVWEFFYFVGVVLTFCMWAHPAVMIQLCFPTTIISQSVHDQTTCCHRVMQNTLHDQLLRIMRWFLPYSVKIKFKIN